MKFSEMVIKADKEINGIDVAIDFDVNKLCYNSQFVERGDVFFAIKGFKTDGNNYINDALSKGAGAVVSDQAERNDDLRIYRVEDCRKTMAVLSNIYYDYPSRKMKIIGVTGTNGKTTVSSMINFVLESWGKKTGLIGTNGNFINKRFIQTDYTTPESVELNSLLADMISAGVEYLSMEVSSHSLALCRVYGIDFDAAVFTNLTPEHMDFHKSMDNYLNSKRQLFDRLERINAKGFRTAAIYNSDDETGSRIVDGTGAERISYGFQKAVYSIENLEMDFEGMKFNMLVPLNGEGIDRLKIETHLTGRFNVYNILASVAVLKQLKVPFEVIKSALKDFKAVNGRFNIIKLANGASAVIDYSHTPDSLLKAITTIKEILDSSKSKGKIITVFGCGGDRDRTKRPLMGEIAASNSDKVVITSDNPRSENPFDIIEEIKAGIKSDNYTVEENREKAIEAAVNMAKEK